MSSARPSPYAPPSAAIPQILPSSISLDEVRPLSDDDLLGIRK
jgi:hypothetical protein